MSLNMDATVVGVLEGSESKEVRHGLLQGSLGTVATWERGTDAAAGSSEVHCCHSEGKEGREGGQVGLEGRRGIREGGGGMLVRVEEENEERHGISHNGQESA